MGASKKEYTFFLLFLWLLLSCCFPTPDKYHPWAWLSGWWTGKPEADCQRWDHMYTAIL